MDQNKKVETPEVKESRHETVDPLLSEKKFEDTDKDVVLLPTETYDKLTKLIKAIDNIPTDIFNETYTKSEAKAVGIDIESVTTTNDKGVYTKNLNDNEHVNTVNYSDKELGIRELNVKSTNKVLSGTAAISKFTSKLGIGTIIQAPLWNSGFWVTLRPPTDSEIINLELAIANSEVSLGRTTNKLVYSNYSVVYNRLVTDFIIEHLADSTIKLSPEDDIRDYILLPDIYPLYNALITTMNPNGYNITKGCKYTTVLEDNKPVCDYVVTGKVDPKKMLYVNRKALTEKTLAHMSKRTPNSTTIDEVKEYQLSLSKLQPKNITVYSKVTDTNINIELSLPTVTTYINNGEAWVNNIITKSEEIITTTDNQDTKNDKIAALTNAVILGVYNIFVTKLSMAGTEVVDKETIDNILDRISSDSALLEHFVNEVSAYIDEATIAIVGMPNYICPLCKEAKRDGDQNSSTTGPFKDIIPVNMAEHFFDLGALRLKKIQARRN